MEGWDILDACKFYPFAIKGKSGLFPWSFYIELWRWRRTKTPTANVTCIRRRDVHYVTMTAKPSFSNFTVSVSTCIGIIVSIFWCILDILNVGIPAPSSTLNPSTALPLPSLAYHACIGYTYHGLHMICFTLIFKVFLWTEHKNESLARVYSKNTLPLDVLRFCRDGFIRINNNGMRNIEPQKYGEGKKILENIWVESISHQSKLWFRRWPGRGKKAGIPYRRKFLTWDIRLSGGRQNVISDVGKRESERYGMISVWNSSK